MDTIYLIRNGGLANLNVASRIALEAGPVDEYGNTILAKIDEFILSGKPKKEKNSIEVSLSAVGRINSYTSNLPMGGYYDKHNITDLINLYQQMLTDMHISVDSKLVTENLQIRSQFSNTEFKESLRRIAIAIRANVYEDIDNSIVLKRIIDTVPVSYISLLNTIDSPQIEKKDIPQKYDFTVSYPQTKGVQEVYNQNFNEGFTKDRIYVFKYNVDHTATPYTITLTDLVDNIAASIEYFSLDNFTVFTWDSDYTGPFNVKITANKVEMSTSTKTYNTSGSGTGKSISDESIETFNQANDIFDWLMSNNNKCFEFKIEIQDICTYELGDTIQLETSVYISGNQVIKKAIITKIEYEYNGALHYYLTLRGA